MAARSCYVEQERNVIMYPQCNISYKKLFLVVLGPT